MKAIIVGTGTRAAIGCKALRLAQIEVVGVWAHDAERGAAFAEEYAIRNVYEKYEDVLEADADLLYIALVNDQHYQFAKEAILSGIPTVVEMPFAGTYERTKELNDLAEENDVFLFEAVTLRTSKVYNKILTALDGIGELRLIRTNAGHIGSARELSGKHSGGALYNVIALDAHFVIDLFGRPKYSLYMANKERNGIDTSGILLMDQGPFKAVCTGSLESVSEHMIEMIGTEGTLKVTFAGKVSVILHHLDGTEEVLCTDEEDLMQEMFAQVKEKLETGDRGMARVWMNRTLQTMFVLDQSRTDAGIDFEEDIKEEKPDLMAMMLDELRANMGK